MLYYSLISAVQIVLESLPISSSTHVALLERVVGISPLSSHLVYLLHIPTVCMLTFFFRTQIISLVASLCRNWYLAVTLCLLIGCIDVITVCFFIFFHYMPITISMHLGICITAGLLYSLKFCRAGVQRCTFVHALILGCVQGLALLPGISRFASVYTAARWLGISHRRAFEITWLCAAPLFGAPVLLVIYKGADLSMMVHPLFVIMVCVATCISYYLLTLIAWLAAHNYLWILSFYMIVPLVLSLIYM